MDKDSADNIAKAIKALADSIAPRGVAPGTDAQGVSVGSLAEAVMGVTAALTDIARTIQDVADKLDRS